MKGKMRLLCLSATLIFVACSVDYEKMKKGLDLSEHLSYSGVLVEHGKEARKLNPEETEDFVRIWNSRVYKGPCKFGGYYVLKLASAERKHWYKISAAGDVVSESGNADCFSPDQERLSRILDSKGLD